jgi:hypothetical protein
MRHILAAGPVMVLLLQAAGMLPVGWKARVDDPAAPPNAVSVTAEKESLKFKSGPAGIYYKPDMKAEKDYELTASFSQLEPSVPPEPYGLFIAGVDLDKEIPRYTAFQIRQDGKFRVSSHNGDRAVAIVDWKVAAQMADPKGVKTSNTLTIRALQGAVHFLIGDREVHQMPRARAGGDGLAGVRIGKKLHVQVDKLSVKKVP